MNRGILTVIEQEHYPEAVIERAAWLAKLNGCDIELFLCDPTTAFLNEIFIVSSEVQELAQNIRATQEQMLEQLADSVRGFGVVAQTRISRDRPVADVIAARAMETEPLYVIKGTHHHSPAERATFADTDWQLMRKIHAPLWFVKPVKWKDDPLIIAAVDPLHEKDQAAALDHRIVAAAQSVAAACNGRVDIVHTYQRLVEIGSYVSKTLKPIKLPLDELDNRIRDEHRKALDAFASDCKVPDDAVHQLPGRAHELLPTFARTHGASLMVMGALSRAGLKERFIGNTAARVLDYLPCDVLIVR